MTAPILVAFATKHGSTGEVAESIATTLQELGIDTEAVPARQVESLDDYGDVVLGGALYMGRWHPDAVSFLHRFEAELAGRTLAVFAMGPRDLAIEQDGSRAQLDHALAKVPALKPGAVAIFGGVHDPAKHHFPFNRMAAFDARDWAAIEAWARELAPRFGYGKPAPEARDPRTQLQQTPR